MAQPHTLSLIEARRRLGVGPAASAAELRQAFRAAAKGAHPDRPGGSAEAFAALMAAYQRLQAVRSTDRIVQPPAASQAPDPEILITPDIALTGGGVERRLSDGRAVRAILPAGLRAGDTVRIGPDELTVAIETRGEVQVRGNDLWITARVPPRTLTDGGRVTLETPCGRRIVWITRTAAERGLVRLVGEGLPARGARARGHLFVRLIAASSEPGSAARTLLRRFAAAWAA